MGRIKWRAIDSAPKDGTVILARLVFESDGAYAGAHTIKWRDTVDTGVLPLSLSASSLQTSISRKFLYLGSVSPISGNMNWITKRSKKKWLRENETTSTNMQSTKVSLIRSRSVPSATRREG